MAARLRKTHQDDVRLKIKTSQLINRLQDHALGKLKDLSPTQLRAIEVLLKKAIPDLSSVDMAVGGKPDAAAVKIEIVKSEPR
ncbi:hypothetical protein H3V53_06260 [Paraburkholderia bengalensis]|uniref:Uncharacterized protein n=1 Tax=Paraburkholderia bengalensis TaxID=2747562 RepID=A0ABU8IMU7_9BURK